LPTNPACGTARNKTLDHGSPGLAFEEMALCADHDAYKDPYLRAIGEEVVHQDIGKSFPWVLELSEGVT